MEFPSPHSGILFLLDKYKNDIAVSHLDCFRPLIRGFFFYFPQGLNPIVIAISLFPSPHSGILFL